MARYWNSKQKRTYSKRSRRSKGIGFVVPLKFRRTSTGEKTYYGYHRFLRKFITVFPERQSSAKTSRKTCYFYLQGKYDNKGTGFTLFQSDSKPEYWGNEDFLVKISSQKNYIVFLRKG